MELGVDVARGEGGGGNGSQFGPLHALVELDLEHELLLVAHFNAVVTLNIVHLNYQFKTYRIRMRG
jgi:hypothetical protein